MPSHPMPYLGKPMPCSAGFLVVLYLSPFLTSCFLGFSFKATFASVWRFLTLRHGFLSCADVPLWLSSSRFWWLVFASANGRLIIFRVGSHRDRPNSYLAFYSPLQLNTFCSYSWNLLFPLLFNYSGVFTWGPVASCSGVSACFTGSGVQQSKLQ